MNLSQMIILQSVVRCGSFCKAAQCNFLSPSSVSRSIKSLEEEINIKLFERSYKGIKLTKQGKEFYAMVEPILSEMDKIEHMYCIPNKRYNILRLTVCIHQSSLASQAILDFYNQYAAAMEYVDIVLKSCMSSQDVVTQLQNKYYMLGVIQYSSVNSDEMDELLEKSSMSILYKRERKMYVSISNEHPLATKKTISINELTPYTRVAFMYEHTTDINYCADLEIYDIEKTKRRILINARSELNDILRATDSYFLGTGRKNINCLDEIGIECIPLETDIKILTSIICRKDCIFTESAKQYRDILINLLINTN